MNQSAFERGNLGASFELYRTIVCRLENFLRRFKKQIFSKKFLKFFQIAILTQNLPYGPNAEKIFIFLRWSFFPSYKVLNTLETSSFLSNDRNSVAKRVLKLLEGPREYFGAAQALAQTLWKHYIKFGTGCLRPGHSCGPLHFNIHDSMKIQLTFLIVRN